MLFGRCFPTVEHLAMAAMNGTFCGKKAVLLVKGTIAQPVVHFRYNYEYYTKFSGSDSPSKHVAVIRTESMWKDLGRLEELLGGDPTHFLSKHQKQSQFSYDRLEYKVNSGLSEKGAFRMCCLIVSELKAYHGLILGSVNLKPSEKLVELQRIQSHCGLLPTEQFFDDSSKWEDWYRNRCSLEFDLQAIEDVMNSV